MHFGNYLLEYKVNQFDLDKFKPIFTKLITEGFNLLNDQELANKGNNMELFHFLSAGPLVINFAPQKFFKILMK
jgi:hypothetical protein